MYPRHVNDTRLYRALDHLLPHKPRSSATSPRVWRAVRAEFDVLLTTSRAVMSRGCNEESDDAPRYSAIHPCLQSNRGHRHLEASSYDVEATRRETTLETVSESNMPAARRCGIDADVSDAISRDPARAIGDGQAEERRREPYASCVGNCHPISQRLSTTARERARHPAPDLDTPRRPLQGWSDGRRRTRKTREDRARLGGASLEHRRDRRDAGAKRKRH